MSSARTHITDADIPGAFNSPGVVRCIVRDSDYGLKAHVVSVGSAKRTRGDSWEDYARFLESTCTDGYGMSPLTHRILLLESRVEDLKEQRRVLRRKLTEVCRQATSDVDYLHEVVDEEFGEDTLVRLLAKKMKTLE